MKIDALGTVLAFAVAAVLPLGLRAAAQSTQPASQPVAPLAADGIPDELRAASETARKMEAARIQEQLSSWDTLDTLPTVDPADKGKWRVANGEVTLTAAGLHLISKGEAGGAVTYSGKRWTLPLGVTYEAMIPRGPLADASLKLLPANQALNMETPANGLAFVVGGYGNTENYLEFLGQANRNIGGPAPRPRERAKVTLLVSTTALVAMIDGQPVANEPLPPRRTGQQLELTLYTYGEEAIFRNVTVMKPKPKDNSVTATAPAEANDEQKAAVLTAAKYLGDTSFDRRQAATEALFMLRPASIATLQEMTKADDMEIISRATQLLARISGEGKVAQAPTISPRIRLNGFEGEVQMNSAPLPR